MTGPSIRLAFTLALLVSSSAARSGPIPPCNPSSVPAKPAGTLRQTPAILAQARAQPDRRVRVLMYEREEAKARARMAENLDDIEARWWLIASLGLRVDEESARGKVELSQEIYRETRWILERDPRHAGANYAMGRLNAGVMRLNPIVRFVALRLVGSSGLNRASWDEAEARFLAAEAEEPCNLEYRYELASAYASQGREEEALSTLTDLLALPDTDPMSPVVRKRAEELSARLRRGRSASGASARDREPREPGSGPA